ncbi:MAG TPA: M14 family metallopeptidase [Casimicrobiaceae bacterium]
MTLDVAAAFSARYAEARDKFLRVATGAGYAIESHIHPQITGAEGEELAIDAVAIGAADSDSLLVVSSGMHGVEGFAGSGCQIGLMQDPMFAEWVGQTNVAVLLVHAINPYGFSHLRRANEDNIDLNRNFRDFGTPVAPNVAYAEVHRLVVPETWPPPPSNALAIGAYLARYGMRQLQAAVSSGQAEFPDGLFYAGREPAWSNPVLRDVLARHGAPCTEIAWIDIHSGLGPWGHGEKILNGPDDTDAIARARRFYGADVTTMYDESSSSALLTGASFHAAVQACPHAEFTGLTLEFGTQSYGDVFGALRAEQWLVNHPQADDATRDSIKRQLRDAFYDERDVWKAMVYAQARVAVLQALRALADPN